MNLQTAAISIAAAGDNTVIAAPGATTCIRIWKIVVSNGVATAQSFLIKDGASTNLSGAIALPTSVGGLTTLGGGNDPEFVLSQNNAFIINLTAATSVTGYVKYTLG